MYFSKILPKDSIITGDGLFLIQFLRDTKHKKLDEVASLVFRPLPCLPAQIHNLINPLINIVVNSVQTLSNFELPNTNSLGVAMFQ